MLDKDNLPREILKRQVYVKLIAKAASKEVVSTAELATSLNLPRSQSTNDLLIDYFNEISAELHAKKHPMLTSVIVKRWRGRVSPTQAWLKCYAKFNNVSISSVTNEDWQKELERVYEFHSLSDGDKKC
jgi:hypothetical protein